MDQNETGEGGGFLEILGAKIGTDDEQLNLTDMWKVAGSPPNKRPAEWARKDGADFIQFIADAENMAVGHIIQAERGRSGATWGHWQLGLAFAKYVSHEFHAAANRIVRDWATAKAAAKRGTIGQAQQPTTAHLNAIHRIMGEIRRSLGLAAVAQAAPGLLATIGIIITARATTLDQGELDIPAAPPKTNEPPPGA